MPFIKLAEKIDNHELQDCQTLCLTNKLLCNFGLRKRVKSISQQINLVEHFKPINTFCIEESDYDFMSIHIYNFKHAQKTGI